MKIICLIREKPPTVHMVNKIHAQYPVSLIIAEQPTLSVSNPSGSAGERLKELIRQRNWLGISRSFWQRFKHLSQSIFYFSTRKRVEEMNTSILGNNWRQLNPEIPILRVKSVNEEIVRDTLEKERPDILIDHGTSIVKPHILACSPIALNLHWGLSPYYRGTHCTDWALLEKDPYNIGVTVHKLTQDTDGGNIFEQQRIIPTPKDTVRSINTKLTAAGTEIIIKFLTLFSTGAPIKFHSQDLSIGMLTYSRQHTEEIEAKIAVIEKKGLHEMLKNPLRKEMPIIENV